MRSLLALLAYAALTLSWVSAQSSYPGSTDPTTPYDEKDAHYNPDPTDATPCPPLLPSFTETSGMRFRRIGLDGLISAAVKEQSKEESDEANEETYVDSLTSQLRHDTSDIYIQLPGGELSLTVKRSIEPEMWSQNPKGFYGDNPSQHIGIDRPFGMAWSSGIGATLRTETYVGVQDGSCPSPMPGSYVHVTDENGANYRFMRIFVVPDPAAIPEGMDTEEALDKGYAKSAFIALPSNRTEQSAFFNTLRTETATVGGVPQVTRVVFTRKFGTTLEYEGLPTKSLVTQLDAAGNRMKMTRFHRLLKATDRFGNTLTYEYAGDSLIPSKIIGRAGQGGAPREILIEQAQGLITAVTDPRGNRWTYEYDMPRVGAFDVPLLRKVTTPENTFVEYTYDTSFVGIPDNAPRSPGDTSAVDRFFHILLGSIRSNNAATIKDLDGANTAWGSARSMLTTFKYEPDMGVEVPTLVGSGGNFSLAFYKPYPSRTPVLAKVILPDGAESLFKRGGVIRLTSVPAPGGVGRVLGVGGTRTLEVTDAAGSVRKFEYKLPRTIDGQEIENLLARSSGPRAPFLMLLWGQCVVTHPDQRNESATFGYDNGLADIQVVDYSGNVTTYEYGDPFKFTDLVNFIPAGSPLGIALNSIPSLNGFYNDPTRERIIDGANNQASKITEFAYLDTNRTPGSRVMKSMIVRDGAGTVVRTTEYDIDAATGNRTEERIYGGVAGSSLVRRTQFSYHPSIKGFMTRTRVIGGNFTGAGFVDHVVETAPDAYGNLATSTVDPGGLNLVTSSSHDANGNQTASTDPRGNTTTFQYDKLNRLVQVTHPDDGVNGVATTRTMWSPAGRKLGVQNENGNRSFTEYDLRNRPVKTIVDMDGAGVGGLGSVTAADLVTTTTYNGVGRPLDQTDARGTLTRNSYDALHRLTQSVVDPGGLNLTTQFDYSGPNVGGNAFASSEFKPTVKTDPRGFRTKVDYDHRYRPVSNWAEVSPDLAACTSSQYDVFNNVVVAMGWRALASLGSVPTGPPVTTTSTFDALDRPLVVTITGESGAAPVSTTTTTYSPQAAYRVTKVDADASTSQTRVSETDYDAAGRAVRAWQPDPVTGMVVRSAPYSTSAGSPMVATSFDANGNPVATVDVLGRQTDTDFDARNRAWRVRLPAVTNAEDPPLPVADVRPTTLTRFDAVGNVVATTDARGSVTRSFFDRANRPVASRRNPVTGNPSANLAVPAAGDVTTVSGYDKGGLVVAAVDGNGNVTRNGYDAAGRLVASATDPADGNPSDPNAPGFNPAALRAAGATEQLVTNAYDASGNLIEVVDGKGQVTRFSYDGLGRKTQTIWDPATPVARIETFVYDALLQTARIDAAGRRTDFLFDGRHRQVQVVYAAAAGTAASSHPDNQLRSYDPPGKLLGVSYPNDPGSLREVALTYDALDRLTSETSAGVLHSYPAYDKAGNRLVVNYGRTGRQLVSSYDALNRLATLAEKESAAATTTRETSYAYDLGGNVTRKVLPNGNRTDTTRDLLGRTLKIEERTAAGVLVSGYDYSAPVGGWPSSYDAAGNVLRCAETLTRSGMSNRVVANAYDHVYRLATETVTPAGGAATTTSYAYDKANNRVAKTAGGATTAYLFGDATNGANSNQLVAYGPAGGAATHTFTYDANGNRATRTHAAGTDTYTWDFENRLTAVSVAGTGSFTYTYDYRTRRIGRDESAAGGTAIQLSFSGGLSVQEATAAGAVQTELVRGSDWGGGVGGVLYSIRGTSFSFNAYNSRGDVVSTTDSSGAATWQAAYEAFGTRTAESGTNAERQRANTKDEDPTGLLNEGFRYRDLEAGVFISRDPAGFVDGPNVYTYVRQNPWSAFDPDGLQEELLNLRSPKNSEEYRAEVNRYNKMLSSWEKASSDYKAARAALIEKSTRLDSEPAFDLSIDQYRERVSVAEENLRKNFGSEFQDDLAYTSARLAHYQATADALGNVPEGADNFHVKNRPAMDPNRGYRTIPLFDPVDFVSGMAASRMVFTGFGRAFAAKSVAAASEGSAFGGALYSETKLQHLVPYLNKRGVTVFETAGNPAFVARANGTGTMYLPANPTVLQVKHELSHFLDFRKMGFDAYNAMGRAGREASVLQRLQGNRSWGSFNAAEQAFSIQYSSGLGK